MVSIGVLPPHSNSRGCLSLLPSEFSGCTGVHMVLCVTVAHFYFYVLGFQFVLVMSNNYWLLVLSSHPIIWRCVSLL